MAGSWYPREPDVLASYLDGLLNAVQPVKLEKPVIAIISPHAGYRFSGKAAAAGYAQLRGQDIRRVVVLAPSHHTRLRGASISDVTHFETPLGLIPLDGGAIAQLRKAGVVKADAQAEVGEHSLEMQLPFLQRVLPRFSLVPILVGDMDEHGLTGLAQSLAGILDDHTLVVASSDFTHRGANFRYEVPKGKGDIRQRLARVDDISVEQLTALSRRGLEAHVEATGTTICGIFPIGLLLELLHHAHGVRGQVLSRYTSGDVTSDWTSTVTYIDMVFSGKWSVDSIEAKASDGAVFPLSPEEKTLLLRLARRSLEAAVRKGAFDDQVKQQFPKTASLERKAGAFVTLKCRMNDEGRCTARGRDLRGCIGTIEPVDSVFDVVARRAASAAMEDTRFPYPVSVEELPWISIEISVLTPPTAVNSHDDIIVGKHGIVLSSGSHRATFLPQVAPEQGWTRDVTLRHLARKAGLPEDGWKSATLEVYEAIVFGEEAKP
jgi:AmmeMemoRadiSam system protein B/AmmeMemoRadiSam system protein A